MCAEIQKPTTNRERTWQTCPANVLAATQRKSGEHDDATTQCNNAVMLVATVPNALHDQLEHGVVNARRMGSQLTR